MSKNLIGLKRSGHQLMELVAGLMAYKYEETVKISAYGDDWGCLHRI